MKGRVLWRAARVAEHLLTGIVVALYTELRGKRRRPRWLPRAVQWWHRRLLRALGVQVRVKGRLEPQCLLVSNHISWVDIPVLGAQGEVYFLSKAEVRRWPVIGWLAELAGTRFIERGSHQSGAVREQLQEDLKAGRTIAIFPEGTTTDGRGVGPFYPRLFAIAQASAVSIQPIALRYRRHDHPGPDQAVPYVGDDTLLASLWRLLHHPGLVAEVQFLPPITPQAGISRRALAQQVRKAIVSALAALDQPPQSTAEDNPRPSSPSELERPKPC